LVFSVVTLDLQGFPGSGVPPVHEVPEHDPPVLRRVFEDTDRRAPSFFRDPVPVATLRCPDLHDHGFQTSSLGFVQRSPLRRHQPHASCPGLLSLERDRRLRPNAAKRQTPSVLAVSLGFDGLRRMLPCRFVAPCSQSWGSSCFRMSLPPTVLPRPLVLPAFPKLAVHTLRSVSLSDSRTASPQPLPSRR